MKDGCKELNIVTMVYSSIIIQQTINKITEKNCIANRLKLYLTGPGISRIEDGEYKTQIGQLLLVKNWQGNYPHMEDIVAAIKHTGNFLN
jgi:hypothetical protein